MRLQRAAARRRVTTPTSSPPPLTQPRLRAGPRPSSAPFAQGMLFTADGLEQATRLEVAAHARRAVPQRRAARPCTTSAAASAPTPWRWPALDLRCRAVDADAVTAAIADVNLRPLAGLAGPGRAGPRSSTPARRPGRSRRRRLARPGPPRARASTDVTGRTKRVFSLDAIRPSWEFVLQVATRRAGHRGQAQPVDPARRDAPRRRGAVDLLRRRGARVRRVVGAAGAAPRPHAPRVLRPGPRRPWWSTEGRWPSRRPRPVEPRPPSGRGSTSPTAR